MNHFRHGLRLLFKAAISVAFFSVLFSFVQGNELLEVLASINWLYFFLCFALTPVLLGVSCAKWKIVLDKSGVEVPFWELMRIYFIGYFFSNILPSTVGGDVVRSFYSGKRIENQAYAAVAIFIERFSGILLLLLLVIVMPALRPDLYRLPYLYLPALGALMLLAAVVIVGFAGNPIGVYERTAKSMLKIAEWLFSLPLLKIFHGVVSILTNLHNTILHKVNKVDKELKTALHAIQYDRVLLARIVYLTAVFYFLTMANVYFAYKAFDVEVSFVAVCALVPTALFMAQIPVTLLGNLGYYESVFVGFFLLVGIPTAESLAMGLLLRMKILALGVLGYIVYLSYKNSRSVTALEIERLMQGGKGEKR